MTSAPIIVTLQLDAASTAFFEAQRQAHFPAAINRVRAHLTLFHALPGDDPDAVLREIAAEAMRPSFPLAVTGLIPLGRGVAYRIESDTLLRLRERLASRFAGVLTRLDREKFRPHVTIQNKVAPASARALLQSLAADFAPLTATAEGLQLFWYRGGPWSPLAAVAFAAR